MNWNSKNQAALALAWQQELFKWKVIDTRPETHVTVNVFDSAIKAKDHAGKTKGYLIPPFYATNPFPREVKWVFPEEPKKQTCLACDTTGSDRCEGIIQGSGKQFCEGWD